MKDQKIISTELSNENADLDIENFNANPENDLCNHGIRINDIKAEADKLTNKNIEDKKEQINPFPVDAFPLEIQNIISATNESLNFPIDYIGGSILYAISISIGNTHMVELMKGWSENAVIYLAMVGRPGSNKSHPLNFALNPINDEDLRKFKDYEEKKKEYDKIVHLTKAKKENESVDEPIKPICKKHLLSDFTPEALATVHKDNERGIGAHVDELAGWFKNFNRYNGGSEMEFWLSAWSGGTIKIDRKTGEPVNIALPFISVAGTIQNGVLNDLGKDNRTQNGFIDRILFVVPNDLKKTYWSEIELDPTIIKDWEKIILKLLRLTIPNDNNFNLLPEILRFEPEAKRMILIWQKSNTDQCNNAENENLSSIYCKLEIYALRLSLILELMFYACGESNKQSISTRAVEGALKLVEYFRKSAERANSIISNTNPLEKHPSDKKTLYKTLPINFTTAIGVDISEKLGIPERTFKRFLNEKELFKQVSRGNYKKLI